MTDEADTLATLHELAAAFNAHDVDRVMSFSRLIVVSTCRVEPSLMGRDFTASS